ncbi:hypothetical protein M0R45_030539 [Rubus argutus]|uniref:Uncharacterized protein n=1 Tax=Rubus argutus TaxID=59490 RepID=A0AAW1WBF3_RUBAR
MLRLGQRRLQRRRSRGLGATAMKSTGSSSVEHGQVRAGGYGDAAASPGLCRLGDDLERCGLKERRQRRRQRNRWLSSGDGKDLVKFTGRARCCTLVMAGQLFIFLISLFFLFSIFFFRSVHQTMLG